LPHACEHRRRRVEQSGIGCNNGEMVAHSLRIAGGAAAGAFAWTATEYATHRWVLHSRFGMHQGAGEATGRGMHGLHHRAPLNTRALMRFAGHVGIASVGVIAAFALSTAMPTAVARSAAAVWSAGYSTYEISHWNMHHRPARTAWGHRQRARHHRHHHGAPRSNLGVTTAFWDQLFGTEAPAQHG